MQEFLLDSMAAGREMVTNTRIGMGSDPRGKGTDNTRYTRANGRIFAQARKSYDFWIDNGLALVGSPETVTQLLKDKQERIGFSSFAANHHIGRMPGELVDKSIKLLAEGVFPEFEVPELEPPESMADLRINGPQHVGMAP